MGKMDECLLKKFDTTEMTDVELSLKQLVILLSAQCRHEAVV